MKVIICELQVVKVLACRINELESFKAISENISENLQQENTRLITNLKLKVDDQEQRSRNACLFFHGIQENIGDNTNNMALALMNNNLGLRIQNWEIQHTDRVGSKVDKRNLRSAKSHI